MPATDSKNKESSRIVQISKEEAYYVIVILVQGYYGPRESVNRYPPAVLPLPSCFGAVSTFDRF